MCPTPVILPPVSSSLLKIQVYVTGHILQKFLNLSSLLESFVNFQNIYGQIRQIVWFRGSSELTHFCPTPAVVPGGVHAREQPR